MGQTSNELRGLLLMTSSKGYRPFLVLCALVLVLILAVATISFFWPKYETKFFELGLLGSAKTADNYFPNNSSDVGVGYNIPWFIYVGNHMGSVQNIAVRLKLLNSTMQAPIDQEHKPSPYPYFFELPTSLSVDEKRLIPLSWSVSKVVTQKSSTTIKQLVVNGKITNLDVTSVSDNRFRIVFELWVYDSVSNQYVFLWSSGKDFYSASLYMWFRLK